MGEHEHLKQLKLKMDILAFNEAYDLVADEDSWAKAAKVLDRAGFSDSQQVLLAIVKQIEPKAVMPESLEAELWTLSS